MKTKNKKLSGGLANLIGGADRDKPTSAPLAGDEAQEANVLQEQAAGAEEATQEATPEEEQELINSIEDEELRAALEAKRNAKRGRPRKGTPKAGPTQEEEYTRFCTLVRREQIAKLKEICFLETLTLKEILSELFQRAIDTYEETHGEIVPKQHKGDVASLFKK